MPGTLPLRCYVHPGSESARRDLTYRWRRRPRRPRRRLRRRLVSALSGVVSTVGVGVGAISSPRRRMPPGAADDLGSGPAALQGARTEIRADRRWRQTRREGGGRRRMRRGEAMLMTNTARRGAGGDRCGAKYV